jgi:hypothetical protein
VHVYSRPGKFYVCLSAEAGPGCLSKYCDSVQVRCDTGCRLLPRFTQKADSLHCNTVRFTNASLVPGTNTRFSWIFGDGTYSQESSPAHSYAKPGIYQVCLLAAAGNQCQGQYCDSVRISCTDSCRVSAAFIHYSAGFPLLLEKLQVLHPDPAINYYWNFGDGSSGQGPVAYHDYTKAGTYAVCLRAEFRSCHSESCQELKVGPACDSVTIIIGWEPTRTDRPNEWRFRAGGADSLSGIYWTIYRSGPGGQVIGSGPLALLQQRDPLYLFSDTGWYRVCVQGQMPGGCKKESCRLIHIAWKSPEAGRIQVYPNPAHDYIRFGLNLELPGDVIIKILNSNGLIEEEFVKTGVAGNNTFTLPVGKLSHGIYYMEVISPSRIWFSRFHKG